MPLIHGVVLILILAVALFALTLIFPPNEPGRMNLWLGLWFFFWLTPCYYAIGEKASSEGPGGQWWLNRVAASGFLLLGIAVGFKLENLAMTSLGMLIPALFSIGFVVVRRVLRK